MAGSDERARYDDNRHGVIGHGYLSGVCDDVAAAAATPDTEVLQSELLAWGRRECACPGCGCKCSSLGHHRNARSGCRRGGLEWTTINGT